MTRRHVIRNRPAKGRTPQQDTVPVEPDCILAERQRRPTKKNFVPPSNLPAPAGPAYEEGFAVDPWIRPTEEYGDCAVVWVAGGYDYARDAHDPSAASIKREMPNVQRLLVCDEAVAGLGHFTRTYRGPRRQHPDLWYLDSVKYYDWILRRQPEGARLLFLDTDTYCCAPMYDVFDLLDRFDLVGAHGITRHTTGTHARVPDSFPELCIGMLAVRNNARTRALFQLWLELYAGHVAAYGNNDQGPLREALWLSPDVRLYVVTPEYHCRAGFGAYLAGRVRLVHSRARLVEMAGEVNERGGMRLYRPGGVIWYPGCGS